MEIVYERKHTGYPFTEANFVGEFIELRREEHEALLAERDRYRAALEEIAHADIGLLSNRRPGWQTAPVKTYMKHLAKEALDG